MVSIGLGLGGLIMVIGLVTAWLAPKVGPNPIFGVRVGYAYASRQVWDRTNRFGGALMAWTGAALAAVGFVLEWLGVPARAGMPILTGGLVLALLAEAAWMFLYARRLAQATPLARETAPVPFRWRYLAPVGITFILLVLLAAYIYPVLPPERMATHFDIDGNPNGWMGRDGFFVSFVGLAAFFVVLNAGVVFVATREPLIAFERLGKNWLMQPERGLIYTGLALGLANVIFLVVLADVAWFNLNGAHLFPLAALFVLIVPVTIVLVGLFFILGRRESDR